MMKELVTLSNVSVTMNGVSILKAIRLEILQGQQWAIVGKSGSGKTTLAQVLTGRLFHNGVINFGVSGYIGLIEQQHRFRNRSNTADFYYQQRYNSLNAEDTITVAEALHNNIDNPWVAALHLIPLLQEPLIQLSNGENKRLQLAKALLKDPSVLVMDNPFVGLDTEGRQTLHTLIDTIVASGIHVILVTTPQDLPISITHVAVLEDGMLTQAGKKEAWTTLPTTVTKFTGKIPGTSAPSNFSSAVKMIDVTVRYGDKTILDSITWEVKQGERWSISGPNGAGKSTLLSLITADNPQAYANQIYLFDQRRGSGETIWDIKKRIGFVSPELHVFFDRSTSCFDVIASGLFDTIGLFRQLSHTQQQQVKEWISLLQLEALQRKPLFQLSLGQQRMVLLARALVKNPPLLILDEPTQGLDEEQIAYFRQLIDALCEQFGTTLLFVSHYTKDIPDCVTHAARIENGRLTITA